MDILAKIDRTLLDNELRNLVSYAIIYDSQTNSNDSLRF